MLEISLKSALESFDPSIKILSIENILAILKSADIPLTSISITEIEDFLAESDRSLNNHELGALSQEVIQIIQEILETGNPFTSRDLNDLLSREKYLLADPADVMMELTNAGLILEGDQIYKASQELHDPLAHAFEMAELEAQKNLEVAFETRSPLSLGDLGTLLENYLTQGLSLNKIISPFKEYWVGPEKTNSSKGEKKFAPSKSPPQPQGARPKILLNEELPTRSWKRENPLEKLDVIKKKGDRLTPDSLPTFSPGEDVVARYQKWDKFVEKKGSPNGQTLGGVELPPGSWLLLAFVIGGGFFYSLKGSFASSTLNFETCRINRVALTESIKGFQLREQRPISEHMEILSVDYLNKIARSDLIHLLCPTGGEFNIKPDRKNTHPKDMARGIVEPAISCSLHKAIIENLF